MKRALVTAVLLATTQVAAADKFVGLGIGPAPALSDNNNGIEPDGRSGRILGGFRFGRLSVEGSFTGFDFIARNRTIIYEYGARQLGIAGKLNLPIGYQFEAYGKAGLQHTWYTSDEAAEGQGNGILLGAGIEYRLDLGVASGSAFLEYGYTGTDGTDDLGNMNTVRTRLWMLGLLIGI